jgi:hypothetical protein
LPEAGSLLTSDLLADHLYRMPHSYQEPNAILIDTIRSNTLLTFVSATNCSALSFLTSSGAGRNLIRYTIFYSDDSSETGAFISPNWYSDGDPAWAANGRVNVATFTHADLNSYNPRLYSADVVISNPVSPIKAIDLSIASGTGHTAIFAVSGAPSAGSPFVPIEIKGYNEDLVVEASAVKPGFIETNSTATMDTGTANAGFTWYEKGYNAEAPETGLPAAGSLVSSEADPNHRFLLSSNYAQANAMLIDAVCSNLIAAPLQPASYSVLSFLTAAASGPMTNQCVITHSNGRTETNSFVAPDWLGQSAPALTTHARVNVSTKFIDQMGPDGPRLYAVDMPITQNTNPITRIRISPGDAKAGGHTVIFAISGLAAPASNRPWLSVTRNADERLTIRSSQPGKLQSCLSLSGANTIWTDEGPVDGLVTVTPVQGVPVRFYRVVALPQ